MNDKPDILDRLKNLAAGDPSGEMKPNQWGEQLAEICKDAIAEIEQLRASGSPSNPAQIKPWWRTSSDPSSLRAVQDT